MAAPHHFVHLVMKLRAEAVRTRMNRAASPHHRIVSGKSGTGGNRAAPRAPGRAPDGSAAGLVADGGVGSPGAPHRSLPSRSRCNPVMW